jgi:sulfate permease, SulP family
MLIAIVLAALAAVAFHLPVETIGGRFGDIPQGVPIPRLPNLSMELFVQILPAAASFTLLGGVESLLSAKVADGMTGRKHRSNMELVAQGIANIASAMFGGISVTGTIARTGTNIRAGARSLSPGLHAGRCSACALHPAFGACWRPGGRLLVHGRERRIHSAVEGLA